MLRNFLALVYVSIAWGSAFILIKFAEETIGPLTIQAGRCSIGFVAILILSIVLGRDLRGHFKYWFAFLVFAVLGIVILWITVAFGEKYISPGLATVLVTVSPLVTFIISAFILRTEKVTVSGITGLALGVVGLVLVVGVHNLMAGGATMFGALLIVIGYTIFSINGVLTPKLASGTDPLASGTYYMGMASIMLWVLAFIFERPLTTHLTLDNTATEIVMGVFSFASGFIVYYWLLNRAGPFFSSLTFYLLPIVGIVGGYLMFDDTIGVGQIAGILVVFLGVFLINKAKLRKE